ncbi:MAG: uracil phosphoribosyltransferase [candidate division Zixibacteria bacterium]|nr:uracil phosphoribosyltransferase [candidate division Zixibacteria bacterium]
MHTLPLFPNLFILGDHALIGHRLAEMRKKETPSAQFRDHLGVIGALMGYEMTRDLPGKDTSIETPLARVHARMIDETDVAIVSVLRAGLGMALGLRNLLPGAREGHIGVFRDPYTKRPVEYYSKLPAPATSVFIVVDPMVATGHSAVCAVDVLNAADVPDARIRFMALIAAPEGVRVFHAAHPSVPLYTAALDSHLDDHAYIVPGLGDAGDRLFGT